MDFWLFPKAKKTLPRDMFGTMADVRATKERVTRVMDQESFAKALEKWEARWQKLISREGCYLEK